MTADPAIRAALRAGALAMTPLTAEVGGEPSRAELRRAAASIAAFLRALPDQYSRGGAAFWDAIPAEEETRLWLAAAVDAVAREAGE